MQFMVIVKYAERVYVEREERDKQFLPLCTVIIYILPVCKSLTECPLLDATVLARLWSIGQADWTV